MRYILILSILLVGSTGRLSAQIQRIMHQSFPLSDSIAVIDLDIYGEYKVETWPGENVLLETQVKLYNASRGILDHFVESGRFELEAQPESALLLLVSKDKERRPLTTSKGECFEEVKQRLFIPEEFLLQAEHRWVRPVEEKAEASPSTPDSSRLEIKEEIKKDTTQQGGAANG